MATRFEIPDAEGFLPRPSTSITPSLGGAAPLSFGIDDSAVQDFLSNLESARAPEPQKLKTWQKVVGALGDALTVYAKARLGQPTGLGPFATQQIHEQERQRAAEMSASEENRKTRNEARMLFTSERMRREREESVARIRGEFSPIEAESGFAPESQTYVDAAGQFFFVSLPRGRQGVGEPIVTPVTPGVKPKGRLRLARPQRFFEDPSGVVFADPLAPGRGAGRVPGPEPLLTPQPTDQPKKSAAERLNELLGGPSVQPVVTRTEPQTAGRGQLQPRPRGADVDSIVSSDVLSQQLDEFESLAAEFSRKGATPGKALGQTVIRSVPLVGQGVSEAFGDPGFEALAALRGRIGQQLARSVESGRLSDQDRDFALENLPTIVSLTTPSGRKTALEKIRIVRREIAKRMAEKLRRQPELAQ